MYISLICIVHCRLYCHIVIFVIVLFIFSSIINYVEIFIVHWPWNGLTFIVFSVGNSGSLWRSLYIKVPLIDRFAWADCTKAKMMKFMCEFNRFYIYFQELLTRSSLETHKLDLMAEMSSLKIRLATAENERRELEERLKQSQVF